MTIDYVGSSKPSLYKVIYLVNATKARLVAGFSSYPEASAFARKIKYSRKCTLIAEPAER